MTILDVFTQPMASLHQSVGDQQLNYQNIIWCKCTSILEYVYGAVPPDVIVTIQRTIYLFNDRRRYGLERCLLSN
jgi:hypothetical protein